MTQETTYQSPLSARYASPEMQAIWSSQRKFSTWRRLWLALAESEKALGLEITDQQINELRAHLDDIDYASAAKHEKRLRHDVMAHVHTLGEVAPTARPIIHLGATSQFLNCNTELMQQRDALELIANRLASIVDALGRFAKTRRNQPTLGFTHYQPAQPTTIGKRACLWAQEFAIAIDEIETRINKLGFRGVKGATGTQASFMSLFDGDANKVEQLDRMVTEKMGWNPDQRYVVTGQTYPRIVDAQILSALAIAASAAHKCATDIRLLANHRELEEPFESNQIGSSAMAYKRNPMRCERICALSRFVMSLPTNAFQTASVQWLERTLDDSANRRLTLPEGFLALDGLLATMQNVAGGLIVNDAIVTANLQQELPFLATENLMMAAAAHGADRQEAHEIVRKLSQEVGTEMKQTGCDNDLLKRLAKHPMFAKVDLEATLDPMAFIGRAPQQVDEFISLVVEPIRARYAGTNVNDVELQV